MRVDRAIAIVATALLAGGWVCQAAGDNPCPGGLTCAVDVANVCCPFDRPYTCDDHCTSDPGSCPDGSVIRACSDEAHPAACTFAAAIDAASCSDSVDGSNGIDWRVQASGTITGCGQEGFSIADVFGVPYRGLRCGSWTHGAFSTTCVPTSSSPTTTSWSVDEIDYPLTAGATLTFDVNLGSDRVLATATAVCGM